MAGSARLADGVGNFVPQVVEHRLGVVADPSIALGLGAATGAADPVVARAAPAPPSSPATVMPATMNGRRDRPRGRSAAKELRAAKELSAPIDLVVRMGSAGQVVSGPGPPGWPTPSGGLAGPAIAG